MQFKGVKCCWRRWSFFSRFYDDVLGFRFFPWMFDCSGSLFLRLLFGFLLCCPVFVCSIVCSSPFGGGKLFFVPWLFVPRFSVLEGIRLPVSLHLCPNLYLLLHSELDLPSVQAPKSLTLSFFGGTMLLVPLIAQKCLLLHLQGTEMTGVQSTRKKNFTISSGG